MKIRLDPLDILFSKYVKLLAEGKCCYCGKVGTQTSHFHSRRKRSVRWDVENCCFVCFSCHMFFHEHPNKHVDFFKQRLGSERFEALNVRAETLVHLTKLDKEKIKAELKEKIRLLEASSDN